MKRVAAWCLCACMLGVSACKVERPDTVLSDTKMEDVLYDYHIAKAMGEEMPYSENFKRVLYIESVYRKHGITKADFDSSMVWFSRNPEALHKIYEKVNVRLKAVKEEISNLVAIRDNRPKESQPGDSIDVWIWQQVLQLTGMPLDNKLTFTLPSDTNFHDRDTLRWNVRFHFLRNLPDSAHAPLMAMQVAYDSDTAISVLRPVYREGMETLTLFADTLGKIKEVSGFIYYPMQKKLGHDLLIDSVSLMRYHATDTLTFAPKAAEPKEKEVEKKEEKATPKPTGTEQPRASRPRPASPNGNVPARRLENGNQGEALRPIQMN